MAAATQDLFRFLAVRGPNTPEQSAHNRRFVSWALPANDKSLLSTIAAARTAKKPIEPVLIVELAKLSRDAKSQELARRIVETFRKESASALTKSQFSDAYPTKLHDVYLWHRDNNRQRTATIQNFVPELEKAIGSTIANFLAAQDYFSRKLRLWENLFAEYLVPSEKVFLAELQDMVRWFWVIEKLGQNEIADGQALYEAMTATVLIPSELVPTAVDASVIEEPSNPTAAERRLAQERIGELSRTHRELQDAMKRQQIDQKHSASSCEEQRRGMQKEAALPADDRLSARYLEALSAGARKLLDDLQLSTSSGLNYKHARERLADEARSLSAQHDLEKHPPTIVNINGRLLEIDDLCHHPSTVDPCAPYRGPTLPEGCGLVRTPGFADLKVIRSTLLKYDLGEIAHIENILKGEVKVREFNTLNRSESVITREDEITSEAQRETQTTDRFEVERELSSMVKEDMKFDTGVKVTASLGPVSLDSHVDFTYARQKEESNKVSTKSAQEMVNKAVSRVIERNRTQSVVTTILQTEERNSHTFSNKGNASKNIHGVYYWLDKYYLAKVVNYGKRLMYEFVIPEPAAFYIYSKANRPVGPDAMRKPVEPSVLPFVVIDGLVQKTLLTSAEQIDETNYAELAALYNAVDVKPPNPAVSVIGDSIKCEVLEWEHDVRDQLVKHYPVRHAVKELKVPGGYVAERGYVTLAGTGVRNGSDNITLLLGKVRRDGEDSDFRYTQEFFPLESAAGEGDGENDIIPFAIWAGNRHDLVVNVEVVCRRTDKAYKTWQQDTFNAIMKAYGDAMKAFIGWQKEQSVTSGIVIRGDNPDRNRATEREELKKSCVSMMTGQRFETFDAMRSNVPDLGFPEFSFNEAMDEGDYIQFFEQAFEWEQITYAFYPYFWGRKPNWVTIKGITDPDPLFTNFLQAGAARVLVPVRPGFEGSVVHYFASKGQIWKGNNPPIPGDPEWIAIVDELKEQQGQFNGGEQEGDPWIYKLPTSLVYLDDLNNKLPDHTPSYPHDVAAALAASAAVNFS